MKLEKDHIWPRREGGPDDEWNRRLIPQAENRSKGAEMPALDDVAESPDPIKLAVEIDRQSLEGFTHPRNRDKGFGGRTRR